MMTRLLKRFSHLLRDDRGGVLIEVAFIMPLMVTVTLGGVELSRFVLLHQKMERVAATVADLASQAQTMSQNDIDNIMAAVEHVASPFEMATDGVVIISDVGVTGGTDPVVNWQETGAGSLSATSHLGTAGSVATLPTGFVIANDDDVIVAEVFYNYEPVIIGGVTGPALIYQRSFYRPRLGSLTTPPS